MKRVRNFVTLCGGRYTLGLKLNEAQATPRFVSVRFFLWSIPVSIIREFPSREWPRMVFVPTDDTAWHQRFSFRSRREKKGKLLRTGRDKVLSNHTYPMISHKTEGGLELVGSGRVRLETSQWEPPSLRAAYLFANTAAKRLRMHLIEHFRSIFQSHFPVRSKSPARTRLHSVCSLWISCSASCCSCFWLFCSYWNCFYG